MGGSEEAPAGCELDPSEVPTVPLPELGRPLDEPGGNELDGIELESVGEDTEVGKEDAPPAPDV